MRKHPTRHIPFVLLAAVAAIAASSAPAPAAAVDWELTPTVAYRSTGYECTGDEEAQTFSLSDFPSDRPRRGRG